MSTNDGLDKGRECWKQIREWAKQQKAGEHFPECDYVALLEWNDVRFPKIKAEVRKSFEAMRLHRLYNVEQIEYAANDHERIGVRLAIIQRERLEAVLHDAMTRLPPNITLYVLEAA